MKMLPAEYRAEPELALASGRDGLDHTRAILREAHAHLNPGGTLVVEIGHNRRALERAFPRLPFVWPETSAGPGYVFTLGREEYVGGKWIEVTYVRPAAPAPARSVRVWSELRQGGE